MQCLETEDNSISHGSLPPVTGPTTPESATTYEQVVSPAESDTSFQLVKSNN